MNRVPPFPSKRVKALYEGGEPALFRWIPRLRGRVPWRPLGAFPTPVTASELQDCASKQALLVKRDDLASSTYGGNKVRKLEHLLADAHLRGCGSVVTLGGLGSNHALATAIHGSRLGFRPELVLYPQPVTPEVEGAIRGYLRAQARLHYRRGHVAALATAVQRVRAGHARGDVPYFVSFGGTQRLGVLGYVGAALELAEQVRRGECPEPARIFVPLGTAGTAAGLVAGVRLAGLRCRICAVRVATAVTANRYLVRWLAQDALDWIRSVEPRVPRIRVALRDFDVSSEYLGPGYGWPTEAGREALARCPPGIHLDRTYTAKAMAACLDHACARAPSGETVLFWQTYSAEPGPRAESLAGAPPEILQALEEEEGAPERA